MSHDIFLESLNKQQQTTIGLGIGSAVARIEPELVIALTVPTVQADSRFGPDNENLVGAATSRLRRGRTVRAKSREPYPLDAKQTATGPKWANRNALVVGRTYRVSRDTPLMPALNPAGVDATVEAIASRKIIPLDGSITIKNVMTLDGVRWYEVDARDVGNADLGTGFVNADALIGQQVQVR